MSELAAFLKSRAPKKHIKFAACAEWKDENGKPVEWELKPIETAEMSRIRSRCMDVSNGKKVKFDGELFNRLIASAAVVFPNLKDASICDLLMPNAPLDERTPENIICLILRDDDEYQELISKVMSLNNYDKLAEGSEGLVEIAKN